MNYSNVISRTNALALIPTEIATGIIADIPAQSIVLPLATRLPNMTRQQRSMPVLSALPTAYFVSPGASNTTTLKQTTNAEWESITLYAEELAVIVPIPEAVLDDAEYDIWGQIKPWIVSAFGIAIDNAILWGTNAPSTWPTNLLATIVAAGNTVTLGTGVDLYADIFGTGGTLAALEADGYISTANVCHLGMRAKLRDLRDALGNPMFKSSMQTAGGYELDGVPSVFPENGAMNSSSAWMISGMWKKLVYAMRQDITYKVLTEAVIQDGAGNIIYNLAQQDMVAVRCVMRLGWQLPNPINQIQPTKASRCPFAALIP